MKSETTIVVKPEVLKAKAEEMRNLAEKIRSRSYSIRQEQGKGDFVNELETLSEELKNMGSALAVLVSATADRIEDTAAEFTAADQQSAGFYQGGS